MKLSFRRRAVGQIKSCSLDKQSGKFEYRFGSVRGSYVTERGEDGTIALRANRANQTGWIGRMELLTLREIGDRYRRQETPKWRIPFFDRNQENWEEEGEASK